MAARNYPRLNIYDFGAHLLETGDLDPVYIALNKAELDPAHLARWLLAYWCLYHCGAASWLSEQEGANFWGNLIIAADNQLPAPTGGRWPRGSERRHFRGEASIRAVVGMRERFGDRPEQVISYLLDGVEPGGDGLPFAEVAARAKGLPLFGPWISFKVADMLDRLGIAEIDFDQAAVFMFDDPAKAALMFWREKMGLIETAQPKDRDMVIGQVVDHLSEHFKTFEAPPLHDRPVGLQEIETILCKWKSHRNGHYPLFNDIEEIRHGLVPWATHSPTAAALLHAMPLSGHR
jgi:hypothetical protein